MTTRRRPSFSSVLLCACVLAAPGQADRIYRTSGAPIEGCQVVAETLTEVTYQEGGKGKELSIPSDEVVRIEFERVPALVGEADEQLANDEVEAALASYDAYLAEHLGGRPEKRYAWAPAYAAHRLVEIHETLGDPAGVVEAAKRLIESFPESRYLPGAYIASAEALHASGKTDKAQERLTELERLIVKQNLSQRWGLACRLAQVQTDPSVAGQTRRERLLEIEKDADPDFPTVGARAAMARGQSLLADAEAVAGLKEAREIFEEVIGSPSADDRTLAGAYTGLGECLFKPAASSKDAEQLRRSLLLFMRVTVLYKDQASYAPKAMFYAGRCFNLLGGEEDDERANKLYARVMREYPETVWADEARNFRK